MKYTIVNTVILFILLLTAGLIVITKYSKAAQANDNKLCISYNINYGIISKCEFQYETCYSNNRGGIWCMSKDRRE